MSKPVHLMLTEEEAKLIVELRREKERGGYILTSLVFDISANYFNYLVNSKLRNTFTTFTVEFGYKTHAYGGRPTIYTVVNKIIDFAENEISEFMDRGELHVKS